MQLILLEEGSKPFINDQRRINLTIKKVVRNEVLKWLDMGVIYLISDSALVGPDQVVPKKEGMTVIKNEKDELIPTQTVTNRRIYIDYTKLNKATRSIPTPLCWIGWPSMTIIVS